VTERLARALEQMGIRDPRVLAAMAELPRALFVPAPLRDEADDDRPLPIGHGQTISQPYVVAYMTERLALRGHERVLEVGTGSGYQTAVLARLAAEVYSVEIVDELAGRAREALEEALGPLEHVHLRTGDGAAGWPEAAPFDRIMVTAAATGVPPALVAQLAPGGRLILPVGASREGQTLRVLDRGDDGVNVSADLIPVRFVPLTGAQGR
jgi:protein-L-isoaspartate(D-aspartate) O-methyltransferase